MTDNVSLVWGGYKGFEGWMHRGTQPLVPDANDSPIRKLLGTVTATEGGCADSFNGYDVCVWSISYIQLAGSLDLAGKLVAALRPFSSKYQLVSDVLANRGLELDEFGLLRYDNKKVDGRSMALRLYGCDGKANSWTPEAKQAASDFAKAIVLFLRDGEAPMLAQNYICERLLNFVVPSVRAQLFSGDVSRLEERGWLGALQAAYMSFSANLPAVAAKQLETYVKEKGVWTPTDPKFVVGLIQRLTFGPQIAIYPDRYNKIRPVIERLYGVDLPDTAGLLKNWVTEGNTAPVQLSTKQVQEILLQLSNEKTRYDLGPAGADGVMGQKTLDAVRLFQRSRGLVADGLVGPKTAQALVQASEGTSPS